MSITEKNISYTTRHNLCTGCGICQGVCRKAAISMDVENGNFRPIVDETICNGCGLCLKVCSGIGCELSPISETVAAESVKEDKLVGKYEHCYVGHSTNENLRYHSASGGMVTQMLIWLLETKRIDGAIVSTFDNAEPLMVKTILATTRDEIIKAKGSKYAPVSLHDAPKLIKQALGSRYVVVGLPCHIQGFRKLAQIDRQIKEKVIAYFGLYCSCGRTFHLTEFVLKERNIDRKNLFYFAYRDEGCLGSMVAKQRRGIGITSNSETSLYNKDEVYKERYQNYYHPLRSFFIPKRCLFCVDHYASLTDISFGDIHIKPYSEDKIGINSIVARTAQMVEWLEQAKNDGVITLDDLNVEKLNKSQEMAKKKYVRVGTYMKIAKTLGGKVPIYDRQMEINNIGKYFIEYVQTRIQQFIGSHKCMWFLIKVLKSKPPKN